MDWTRVRRFRTLRYQVRYSNGADPETLIATDVAEALRQARQRSQAAQSSVALWREGLLVAECPVPAEEHETGMNAALADRLVAAGIYLISPTWAERQENSMPRPKSREVENENQRTPGREGEPPRPATEPRGGEGSSRSSKTATDAATGEPNAGKTA